MARQYVRKGTVTRIYSLTTKIGTVEYPDLNDVIEFLLRNPVEIYSVSCNGEDMTSIVSGIVSWRK